MQQEIKVWNRSKLISRDGFDWWWWLNTD